MTSPIRIILAIVVLATSMAFTAGASPAAADWKDELDQPVILLHGFSAIAGHNCTAYWRDLAAYLEEVDGRDVTIAGYYKGNSGCEQFMDADQNTSIDSIAAAFRDYILDEFGKDTVDIVAHSMGGIVTRKMLDSWGDELRVDDVVTLGTPHDGLDPDSDSTLSELCPGWKQCEQMHVNSAFIDNLEHNPQSWIATHWTLIGTYHDEVVGPGTSIAMNEQLWLSKPPVEKYQYDENARHNKSCPKFSHFIGHSDLHLPAITRDCEFNSWSLTGDPTKTDRPFRRIRLAIKY